MEGRWYDANEAGGYWDVGRWVDNALAFDSDVTDKAGMIGGGCLPRRKCWEMCVLSE